MSQIRDSRTDLLQRAGDAARDARAADDQVRDLIKDVQKDRARATELARVDVRQLGAGTRQLLAQLVGQQLRGQIPAQLAKSCMAGNVALDVLEQLTQRLANASSPDLNSRLGRATSPEAARDLATDHSVPQQALRWTQFVQKAQHVPGGQVRDRAGVASPKGEGTNLLELLGGKATGAGAGAGLRAPKLVERGIAELSPGQRALLMRATFGEKLATELTKLGVQDPLQLVRAGSLPDGRAEIAQTLNMPRARLLGLLMRAEMLKIPPGKNGELGIRPDMLSPLRQAGIVMLGSLVLLRSLSREELAAIYAQLRHASGGFARAVKGSRPPVKRDLVYWSRAASRKPSDILLADVEERGARFNRADAQELIQAWYMENLFWEQLANARRRQEELEARQQRVQRDERDAEERRQRERREQQDQDEGDWVDDMAPELVYDEDRADHLMCFWITDFNSDPLSPGGLRRMYVCVDPHSGAIIPQSIEAEYA